MSLLFSKSKRCLIFGTGLQILQYYIGFFIILILYLAGAGIGESKLIGRVHVLVLRAVDATALLVVRAVDATASPSLPLPNASGARMWRFGLGPLEGFPPPRGPKLGMFKFRSSCRRSPPVNLNTVHT